ncbi:hypothetical protein BYT27DRAFT_6686856 [Phlegmacium glaucopus]|nr:hypothetical protein BYT27DRAFT_6686856 [Phlegmacium glaucopus]
MKQGSDKGSLAGDKVKKDKEARRLGCLEEEQIVTKQKPRASGSGLKVRTGPEGVCERKSTKPRYWEDDEDEGEGTSSLVQTASPTQFKKRKDSEDQGYERKATDGQPESPRSPRKKTSTRPAMRSPSTPLSPDSGTSNFNFTNNGPGVMVNRDMGNIRNASFSNVGNRHTVNHYHEPRSWEG